MNNYKIDEKGLEFIANFEGIKLSPYKDLAGICTLGIGNTHHNDGTPVKCSDKSITKKEAYSMLKHQIDNHYGKLVNHYVQVPLTRKQWTALVSFAYNEGTTALKHSTLLKKINLGLYVDAASEFKKWSFANHHIIKGLITRREREAELFLA